MEQVFLIYRSDRNCDLRAKCGCAQNNEPFLRLRAVPAASGRNPLASTVELGTIPASSTDMDEQRGRWGSMRRDLGGGDRKRQRLWLRWRPATMGFPTGAPSVPGGGPPGALLTEVEASPVIVARRPFERAARPPARQGREDLGPRLRGRTSWYASTETIIERPFLLRTVSGCRRQLAELAWRAQPVRTAALSGLGEWAQSRATARGATGSRCTSAGRRAKRQQRTQPATYARPSEMGIGHARQR